MWMRPLFRRMVTAINLNRCWFFLARWKVSESFRRLDAMHCEQFIAIQIKLLATRVSVAAVCDSTYWPNRGKLDN